jgi:hypothetical protein
LIVRHEVAHEEDFIEGHFKEYQNIKHNPEIVAKIREWIFKHGILPGIQQSFDRSERNYPEFKKEINEARTNYIKEYRTEYLNEPLSKTFTDPWSNTVYNKQLIHPYASTTRLDSELIADAAAYGVIPIPETMKTIYVGKKYVKTGKDAEAAIATRKYFGERDKYLKPSSIKQFFLKEFF